jgi:Leucine-rich repeat (LRR) protein
LYLAANDIETVDFWLPSSVQMVELGNNKIEKIGKHVFRRAKNLEKLYLHGNWYVQKIAQSSEI